MEMYDYILETPKMFKEIVSNRKDIFKGIVKAFKENDINEIVFIGSGTSYNAAKTAENFIQNTLDIKVSCKYPYLMKNFSPKMNKKAIYIAISQSGTSRLTYEALKKAKDVGCLNASLTSDLNSEISKLSNISLDMSCGEEEVPYKTKGYSATLIDLFLMSIEIAYAQRKIDDNKYNSMISNLEGISENFKNVISVSEKWFEENKDMLKEKQGMYFIGTGCNYGSAKEGALKLIETVKCPTGNYELEEYMHGPQNSTDNNLAIFIISSEGIEKEKASILNKYLQSKIDASYLVSQNGDIKLPIVGKEDFKALELIVPFQILSYKLSIYKDIDLHKKRFPDFDEFVGKKL